MNLKSMVSTMSAVVMVITYVFSPMSVSAGEKVIVFAAASTTNAMTDIAKLYEQEKGNPITLSFASSSTLAKQIENGAPADIFISANPKWMNYLEEKKKIVDAGRFDLLSNRIVLIAPLDSEITEQTIDSKLDLLKLLSNGRLAMGDPDHVPAGMYGQKAMENIGLWDKIKGNIARAKDVRAALVWVERGEAPLGQVYATDAAISSKVKIVGTFPENSHPEIVYPAALIRKSDPAQTFLDYLRTPAAASIFKKYGFSLR